MNSKILILGIAACTAFAAQSALARDDDRGRRHSEYDYARVVNVDPLVRRIRVTEPRRACYEETRYDERERYDDGRYGRARYGYGDGAAGPMILGGIIGAAIGNQVGRGDGRRAATVAGAIIGSAIGHDRAGRRGPDDRYAGRYERYESRPYTVERCDVRYHESWEERIEGYRVTYEYNGRQFTTRLPYDPGERIRVRVDVRPDEP
jgi:uncharacterized protein YcfJ